MCPKRVICYVAIWMIASLAVTTAAAAPSEEQPAAPPSVGQPAPEFGLTLFSGKKITLKEFQGKPVILNFWYSG
jgi:cytochrome oxidase Cu insertion factor (SCO1/SenC/PrrC family)